MNRLAKCLIITFLVSAMLANADVLRADVTSVTTIPAGKNIPVSRSVSVSIVWSVDTNLTGTAALTSQTGEFRAGGTLLGTVAKALSKSINFPPSNFGGGTVTFTETVQVPKSVIFRAHKMGFGSVAYERTFNDTSITPGTGGITLNITGSGGAGFGINRLSIRFDDDSLVRLLPRGEALKVLADITFSGTGLIKAVWEVADPSSTSGIPVYRPLRVIRKQLTASRRTTLTSPELPTDRVGIHLVRLRITDPETGFGTPQIRYFVAKETPDTPPPPAPVRLLAPNPGSELTPETAFGWQAMAGARAYQVELYLRQTLPLSGQPVTGMLMPAGQVQTSLSQLAWQYIKPGEVYLWRVVAIGKNGAIIGESPLREIRTH